MTAPALLFLSFMKFICFLHLFRSVSDSHWLNYVKWFSIITQYQQQVTLLPPIPETTCVVTAVEMPMCSAVFGHLQNIPQINSFWQNKINLAINFKFGNTTCLQVHIKRGPRRELDCGRSMISSI